MTNEENQQELLFKFNMFERQINELQQQIESVERGIVELDTLNFGLDELVGNTGKEMFAPLGKGIFVKAKLISEQLTVDIGQGNFIQKSIPETKKLIQEQVLKLQGIKKELEENLEAIGEEVTKLMNESETKECSCRDNCTCEHGNEECSCGENCECQED